MAVFLHIFIFFGVNIGLQLFVGIVVNNFNANKPGNTALLSVGQKRWTDLVLRISLLRPVKRPTPPGELRYSSHLCHFSLSPLPLSLSPSTFPHSALTCLSFPSFSLSLLLSLLSSPLLVFPFLHFSFPLSCLSLFLPTFPLLHVFSYLLSSPSPLLPLSSPSSPSPPQNTTGFVCFCTEL